MLELIDVGEGCGPAPISLAFIGKEDVCPNAVVALGHEVAQAFTFPMLHRACLGHVSCAVAVYGIRVWKREL